MLNETTFTDNCSPLFEIDMYTGDQANLLSNIKIRLERKQYTHIVTVNPIIIEQTIRNSQYKQIVSESDIKVADGEGIILGAKLLGVSFQERITGVELLHKLLEIANEERYSVYFLGSTKEVASLCSERAKEEYPQIPYIGYCNGYSFENEKVVQEIRENSVDIVFVGMGVPLQETWIYENRHFFSKGLFMGVGGSLDIYSRKEKRCPPWLISLKLEWLYRIAKRKNKRLILGGLLRYVMYLLNEWYLYPLKEYVRTMTLQNEEQTNAI